jgi:hypothetical protein
MPPFIPAFAGMNGGLCAVGDFVASALSGAESIEPLLLLVAQRCVELLERGLHGLHGAQHRIEPLLHRLQAADRGERPIGGTIRAQQTDRLRRGVLQFLERAALAAVGLQAPVRRSVGTVTSISSTRWMSLLRHVRARAWHGVLHFEQKCLRTNMEFVQ